MWLDFCRWFEPPAWSRPACNSGLASGVLLILEVLDNRAVLPLLYFAGSVAIVSAFARISTAAPASVPHARIDLVSEDASLQAGQTSFLGLKFDLKPRWHIYWINAGDSGQPPVVKWKSPSGINVGQFMWPTPRRLPTGPLVDYGYEGSVLLMVPVQVAEGVSGPAMIESQVRLVVCSDTCVPGKASLGISLPVSADKPKSTVHAGLFAATRRQMPVNLPPSCSPSVHDDADRLRLQFRCTTLPSHLTFFPLHANEIENAAPQVERRDANGIELTLAKSDQLIHPLAELTGVIAAAGKSWKISAPITSARQSAKAQSKVTE
jgi:DsbC/DsbD-like thiol-disulfide interchange protein